MTLRQKAVTLIVLVSLGLILLLTGTARFVMLRSVVNAEQKEMQQQVALVQTALNNQLAEMNSTVADWAGWDDTYEFVQGYAPNYIKLNLSNRTLTDLRLNLMRFTNLSGTVVFQTAFDLSTDSSYPVSATLETILNTHVPHSPQSQSVQRKPSIILLPDGPMLAAAQPIQDSLMAQPARGTLLVGRYLSSVQNQLSLGRGTLAIYASDDPRLPDDVREAGRRLAPTENLFVQTTSEHLLAGYWTSEDMLGRPLLFKLEAPRDAYPQAVAYLGYFVVFLFVLCALATLALLGLLQRLVLSPLAKLSADVRQVGQLQNPATRVQVKGKDELASLATDVNDMLGAVWKSEAALRQSEEKHRALVEHIPVVVYEATLDDVLSTYYISPIITTLLGFPYDLWRNDPTFFYKQVHPDDRTALVTTTLAETRTTGRISHSEYRMIAEDGRIIWFRDEARLVQDAPDQPIYLQGAMLDITEQKEAEDRLRYLSTHDVLTGLHNRAYFEEKLLAMTSAAQPISMIVADVDALKTTNDVYGHAAGDALLRRTADILQAHLREGDVLARMGGDEFVALLPNTQRQAAEKIIAHIRQSLDAQVAENHLPLLGLSLGVNTSTDAEAEPLMTVLRRADRAMYLDKITRRPMHTLERLLGPRFERLLKQHAIADAHSFVAQNVERLIPGIHQHVQDMQPVEVNYQQFIEQLPVITYVDVPNQQASTMYVSPQIESILGFRPDEWLSGLNEFDASTEVSMWRKQLHPNDREWVLAELRTADAAHKPYQLEYRMMTRQGHTVWIHDEFWYVLDETGAPVYTQGILLDITDRRRAEERSQAFSELGAKLSATTDPQEAARTILAVADRLLGWDACYLNLCSLENEVIHKSLLMLDEINGQRVELEPVDFRLVVGSFSYKVMTEGKLMLNHEAGPERLGLHGFGDSERLSNSLLFVPLRSGSRAIGVLSIQSYKFHAYTQDDLDTLQALADHCGGALERIWAEQATHTLLGELQQAYASTIEGWSRALELRDKETEGHTQRVTAMVMKLARALGLDETQLLHIQRGALLHDIGKLAVPDHILFKSGPLTTDEWLIMRQHPNHAYQMLAGIAYLQPALDIPYCHHERWDGRGYPRGLQGEEIPLAARIFAVVDVWDAMRSNRPYRDSLPDLTVRDYLRSVAGTQLDPNIVEAFLGLLE